MTVAQTTSAQREPSMEEILASIRRIIEDSDAARSADEAEADPVTARAQSALPAAQQSAPPAAQQSVLEAELPGEGVSGYADQPQAGTGLAEASSALANVADFTSATRQPPQQSAAVHSLHREADLRRQPEEVEPDQADPGDEAEWANEALADVSDEEPRATAVADMLPAAESQSSIISEHASKQVAAAFGELSDVFAASRRRNIDEMAVEMLRPMLQDWLDNNLPTMVERLVREEIERVARGTG